MVVSVTQGVSAPITERKSYARIPQVLNIPNLIRSQVESFDWFRREALAEVYQEISPIKDYTGNKYELYFQDHYFREPKYTPDECKSKEITYAAPLYVRTRLVMKETGEIKEQEIFMGDLPIMTINGTFVVNGAERVVVSQLVRSPGAYFVLERDIASNRDLCYGKLIPSRGAWLEFETSSKDVLSVKVDRKRKVSAATFLRAIGIASDEELLETFAEVDTHETHRYMASTIDRDPLSDQKEIHFREDDLKTLWRELRPDQEYDRAKVRKIANARIEFYRRLRPGEPPSLENARALVHDLFFEPRRYDLGRVGRYKLNSRLGLDEDPGTRTLTVTDLISVFRTMIQVNNSEGTVDDIDHLGNRRVRSVGELVQNQMRVGLLRMERMVRERMTLIDPEQATPQALVNIRPVVAAVREFFGGSQLSQFMDQTNPLAELTHKRRLSALGPGGLSRERAGFDVRDVHFSHYGRICPIETPEGPNIGLLSSLSTYARINPLGFIESPYRRVIKVLPNTDTELAGRTLAQDITENGSKPIARAGRELKGKKLQEIAALSPRDIEIKPFVSGKSEDIIYLSADKEEKFIIAQANAMLDPKNEFVRDRVEVRIGEKYSEEPSDMVDYMDVSPMQITSVSASLIPFLEHDDANRALMGSNMQRQSVPLLRPQAPLVGTGIEGRVARDSGQVIMAAVSGVVSAVTGDLIVIRDEEGQEHSHKIGKFVRTNQGTCFNQRPTVHKGDVIKEGDVLADSSSTDHGDLALGQNVLVAFMSWEGYNYEDAVIISEGLVQQDYFTSVHIEKYEMEARETKLGPEEITRDIPNVGEESLRDLDELGIIRVGAEVGPGDVLVGKVTPKGETELTAEEKLLRAIFGEKSRDVKDTSLRVPHGERGKIIEVKVLDRRNKDELPPGVNEAVRVWVAQTRKVSIGDKMAGRHGNKGVIARILPVEDMPFLEDGTHVDIILNPLGVPSRMNLGQVLETHLGWAAKHLNFRATTPVFDGAKDISIESALARVWLAQQSGAIDPAPSTTPVQMDWGKMETWLAGKGYVAREIFNDEAPGRAREACLRIWLREEAGVNCEGMSNEQLTAEAIRVHNEQKLAPPIFGKVVLYDGRTGQAFHQPVCVGYIYMLKLIHLVEDKIHARSTGPYSLITQQPLGGKAQFGGQRFGEMEVWALEAYGAAHNLQEVLTVKSDDVAGRVKTYEAIVKGEDVAQPGVPESFNVLLKELQSLGMAVELLNEEERVTVPKEISDILGLEEAVDGSESSEIAGTPVDSETAETPEATIAPEATETADTPVDSEPAETLEATIVPEATETADTQIDSETAEAPEATLAPEATETADTPVDSESADAPEATIAPEATETADVPVDSETAEAPEATIAQEATETADVPVDSETAEAPEATIAPEATETADTPVDSETADTPEATIAPEATETADTPVDSETAEAPEATIAPEATETADVPVDSETAEAPEATIAPEATETADTPVDPETAETPEATIAPEATETADTPVDSETAEAPEATIAPEAAETADTKVDAEPAEAPEAPVDQVREDENAG